MDRPDLRRPARQRDVDGLRPQAGRRFLPLEEGLLLGDDRFDGGPHLVGDAADFRPFLRRKRPHAPQDFRQLSLLAQIVNAQFVQPPGVGHFRQPAQRFGFHRFQSFFHHAFAPSIARTSCIMKKVFSSARDEKTVVPPFLRRAAFRFRIRAKERAPTLAA